MTTVAIIGAGTIGGAAAHALARSGTADRVLLIDNERRIAAGKALDILQASAIDRSHTRLEGTDDLDAALECQVCIVADPAMSGSDQEIAGARPTRLSHLGSRLDTAPIVFAGPDQETLLAEAAGAGTTPERLIGSGSLAVAAAARSIVALEADCSVQEVSLLVLGAPEGGFIVPWSQAAIAGSNLERVLTPPQVRRLDERLTRLWPLESYALGVAAARVAGAVLTTARSALGVLTLLDGPFGVRHRAGTVPAVLCRSGIARVLEPALSPRELAQVHTALHW
jgi:malate/lactate dehydrogenase